MIRIGIIGLVLTLLFGTELVAQNGNAILGRWMDEDKETIIEIYEKNDTYHGRIVWLKDSLDMFGERLRDALNADTKLRPRKVLGTNMLENFVWDGADTWRKGEIYYYHSGNEYNGKISISEIGELKLKGYYSILFFLGRTQTWTRQGKSATRD